MGEVNSEWIRRQDKVGIANTKSFLKCHVETYHCRGHLKYICIWKEFKWRHYIMEKGNVPTKIPYVTK